MATISTGAGKQGKRGRAKGGGPYRMDRTRRLGLTASLRSSFVGPSTFMGNIPFFHHPAGRS